MLEFRGLWFYLSLLSLFCLIHDLAGELNCRLDRDRVQWNLWFFTSTTSRRKFRSQTSDNMGRWKAEMGRVREEKRRRKKIKKRKSQKKEDPGARKGRKVAKHCVFQWFGVPEGRKVGSLKRRVRERWQMAHRCGAKHISKSKCTKHLSSGKLWCRKSARRCGAKHISKSKCTKHTSSGPLLEVAMMKKCMLLWREAHFEVKMYKAHHARTTFGNWDVEKVHAIVARSTFRSQNVKSTRGLDHFWTFRCRFAWAKREGFVAFPKTMAGVGHLKRICKDTFSEAGAVQETCSSEMLGGPGADFQRGDAILEHQIFRFVEVILRDRCTTSYDLASLFRGRRGTSDRWTGKIAKTHWYEAVSSALSFPSYRFPVFETSAAALCGTTGKRMWAVHQVILEELTCSVAHAFGGAAGVVYPVVGIGVVSFVRSEHGSFNSFNWKGLEDIEKNQQFQTSTETAETAE